MKELILIRYGEHTDGHLNDQGRETMGMVAEKIKPVIEGKKVLIVCAKVVRAEEGALVLSQLIGVPSPSSYDELYSAEEDGKLPDVPIAAELINRLGEDVDVLIVIASREYIEQLPSYILNGGEPTNLDRGEVLVIDFDSQSMNKL